MRIGIIAAKRTLHLTMTMQVILSFIMTVSCAKDAMDMRPGNQSQDIRSSLQYAGIERTYLLHIPAAYGEKSALPLVLAFHGGGGDGNGMAQLTHLSDISDEEGFMVGYPDGLNGNWNDGRPEINPGVDDIGFISALLDELVQKYHVDATRVYSTGISNGGMFSYRLACELSGKIAAIAPVAALMGESLSRPFAPPRPVPVMIIMGTDDPLVPWDGGEINAEGRSRGSVLSATATVSFWVAIDGCSESPVVAYEPDGDEADGTRVRREVYSEGRNDSEVVFLAVVGGGHTWPGGRQYLRERIIGKTSQDIDAGEVIWDFFQRFHTADTAES